MLYIEIPESIANPLAVIAVVAVILVWVYMWLYWAIDSSK